MINYTQLLSEASFYQYKAVVRFLYDVKDKTVGAEKIAEMVRALPGATRVSTVSANKDKGEILLNVKLISQKTPKEAFRSLKQSALRRFKILKKVEVGVGTIEVKNFIK